MKHTSIRLSDNHAEMIAQSGESPTIVIKKALDLYFDIPPETLEPARKLIDEHVRLYHSALSEHKVSTDIKHIVPQDEHARQAQIEHATSTEGAQDKHIVPNMECKKEGEAIICAVPQVTPEARQALSFILSELEAGREPTSREAADKVGLTPTGLGMMLSKVGIKAQNTRRDLKAVKIYTKPMKAKIEAILKE